jgi:adenylyltransferase/sulfurtransferase
VVELSNLQRQTLYTTSEVGKTKALCAAERLLALNPHVTIEPHVIRLTAANADLLAQYDVILDGSDNFPTRYLVSDACALHHKPLVHGAVHRFEGQVAVFSDTSAAPCYRCLFPTPPPAGSVQNCAEAGVLGVLPGIIGSIQAAEALKILLGIGGTLSGRLLLLDALTMRFRTLELSKNPTCPVCANPAAVVLRDEETTCRKEKSMREITVHDLKAKLANSDAFQLIDVREPHEFAEARIAGATLIPMGSIPAHLSDLDPDAEIVLQCRSGRRSADVLAYLTQQGFTNLANLQGGILAWAEAGYPVEKG